MEVTEAVSHRRQRLSHVVVRQMRVQGAIGSLGREQREGCSMIRTVLRAISVRFIHVVSSTQ